MKNIQIFLFATIILTAIISCEDKDDIMTNSCNVSYPTEILEWLKEIKNDFVVYSSGKSGEIYISLSKYNNNTLFIVGNCCAACNSIMPVYNCKGEELGHIGDTNFDFDLLENDVIIWKPENFVCN